MITKTKAPATNPWGTLKFAEPRTYVPKFHQPRGLRHIDQNSTFALEWDNVQAREKPKTVVDEMKDTLDKINGLLVDLGSRARTKSHVTRAVDAKSSGAGKPMGDSTINSYIESLCDDVSAATDQLKQLSPTQNHRLHKPSECAKPPIRGIDTIQPVIPDRPLSRMSSVSTLDSRLPSIVNAVESPTNMTKTESINLSDSDSEGPVETPTSTFRKRSMSCSGTIGQTKSTTSQCHRGSVMSKEVSMHRSNFNSIADLCGYGNSKPTGRERTGKRLWKASSSSALFTRPNEEHHEAQGVHFAEYPPQRGSQKFEGVFYDDITALIDNTARGLLVL